MVKNIKRKISRNGIFLTNLDCRILNLRLFCFRNELIPELFFILLYALEQIGLIYSTYIVKDLKFRGLIISIYVVLLLSTFALQRIFLRSKSKILEDRVNELFFEKYEIESKANYIYERYKELLKKSKSLNRNKIK